MDGEVVVGRYSAPHEAELAAAYLRSREIAARIDENLVVGMNPLLDLAVGGVRVYVPEASATRASRLLAKLARAPRAPRDHQRDEGEGREPGDATDLGDVTASQASDGAGDSGDVDAPRPARPRQRDADAKARRALATGLVGALLLPGILHCVGLFWALTLDTGTLSRRGRRYRRLALLVNGGILVALLLIVLLGPHLHVSPPPRDAPTLPLEPMHGF